ncbi:hypothetical protein CCACVL1_02099 [Corchorus capsularis]|uniref:Uncharacterized protein n=1 Tax=Corchorus capsularis TaxID=210143 RepID=A0A1R3KCV7_COCAP|nr:hypothetical protein CCACVL1_02099 [Corchorus capsularis]
MTRELASLLHRPPLPSPEEVPAPPRENLLGRSCNFTDINGFY